MRGNDDVGGNDDLVHDVVFSMEEEEEVVLTMEEDEEVNFTPRIETDIHVAASGQSPDVPSGQQDVAKTHDEESAEFDVTIDPEEECTFSAKRQKSKRAFNLQFSRGRTLSQFRQIAAANNKQGDDGNSSIYDEEQKAV